MQNKKYSDLDIEEKISKAIVAHNEGYDVEAFTIIFESINYNLTHLISFETPINYYELKKISYREF